MLLSRYVLFLFIASICSTEFDEYSSQAPRDKRIVGGEVASGSKFKFIALVESLDGGTGKINECTAAVISPIHAITAAHCVSRVFTKNGSAALNMKLFKSIRINDRQMSNDYLKFKRVPIKRTYIHPDYNVEFLENDIAVVELKTPVDEIIEPVIFAENFTYHPGLAVLMSGFGDYNEGYTTGTEIDLVSSTYLREVTSTLWDPEDCMNIWNFIDPDQHVCVGNRERNIARGDSGGPLLVRNYESQWFIIGVASFGSNDFRRAPAPAVYMKTSAYEEWIYNVTGGLVVLEPLELDDIFHLDASVKNNRGGAVGGASVGCLGLILLTLLTRFIDF